MCLLSWVSQRNQIFRIYSRWTWLICRTKSSSMLRISMLGAFVNSKMKNKYVFYSDTYQITWARRMATYLFLYGCAKDMHTIFCLSFRTKWNERNLLFVRCRISFNLSLSFSSPIQEFSFSNTCRSLRRSSSMQIKMSIFKLLFIVWVGASAKEMKNWCECRKAFNAICVTQQHYFTWLPWQIKY